MTVVVDRTVVPCDVHDASTMRLQEPRNRTLVLVERVSRDTVVGQQQQQQPSNQRMPHAGDAVSVDDDDWWTTPTTWVLGMSDPEHTRHP
jgi:hypothetical protein